MAPTVKIRKAFDKVIKGSSISGAMREVGYAPTTASTTNKLTKTKGWQELMEKAGLSDAQLLKKHKAQLDASKHVKLYFDVDDDDELIEKVCNKLGVELLFIKVSRDKKGKTANVKAPDFFYRDLALDKAYKVKGRYAPDQAGNTNNILIVQVTPEGAKKYGIKPSASNDSQ